MSPYLYQEQPPRERTPLRPWITEADPVDGFFNCVSDHFITVPQPIECDARSWVKEDTLHF